VLESTEPSAFKNSLDVPPLLTIDDAVTLPVNVPLPAELKVNLVVYAAPLIEDAHNKLLVTALPCIGKL
jgi:hypothetical protein